MKRLFVVGLVLIAVGCTAAQRRNIVWLGFDVAACYLADESHRYVQGDVGDYAADCLAVYAERAAEARDE